MNRLPRSSSRPSPITIAAPLAVVAAALLSGGGPPGLAAALARPPGLDWESARFTACSGPVRTDCVVDGDTFWYRGEKIRIADINTPETSSPRCRREARLGEQATVRLTELLNAGPFSLASIERDHDSYGRTLRVVSRRGESLGAVLEGEGLAEDWSGHRRDWC